MPFVGVPFAPYGAHCAKKRANGAHKSFFSSSRGCAANRSRKTVPGRNSGLAQMASLSRPSLEHLAFARVFGVRSRIRITAACARAVAYLNLELLSAHGVCLHRWEKFQYLGVQRRKALSCHVLLTLWGFSYFLGPSSQNSHSQVPTLVSHIELPHENSGRGYGNGTKVTQRGREGGRERERERASEREREREQIFTAKRWLLQIHPFSRKF